MAKAKRTRKEKFWFFALVGKDKTLRRQHENPFRDEYDDTGRYVIRSGQKEAKKLRDAWAEKNKGKSGESPVVMFDQKVMTVDSDLPLDNQDIGQTVAMLQKKIADMSEESGVNELKEQIALLQAKVDEQASVLEQSKENGGDSATDTSDLTSQKGSR